MKTANTGLHDEPAEGEQRAKLWEKVGQLLRSQRLNLGWDYPYDVEKHGGPVLSTVKQQEAGDVRTIAGLREHCKALGVEETDLFRAALDEQASYQTLEAAQLLRIFDALQVAKHRRVLLELADSLREAEHQRAPPKLSRSSVDHLGSDSDSNTAPI